MTIHHGPGGGPARSDTDGLRPGCFCTETDGENAGRLDAPDLPASFMMLFATPLPPAPPPGENASPASSRFTPPPAPAEDASPYRCTAMPSSEIAPRDSSGPVVLVKRTPRPATDTAGSMTRVAAEVPCST